MHLTRRLYQPVALAALVVLAACGDSTKTEPPRPTQLVVTQGATMTGTAGQLAPTTATFVVKDQDGRAIGGVPVQVAVKSGGGTLVNAPTQTAASGETPVGSWTLGTAAGTNELSITVQGLTPAVVSATAAPGPASKLVAQSATSIQGVVGTVVTPAPTVRVTDAFDNPVAQASVTVTLTGGGSAPASVTTDAQGTAAVSTWTLGTVKGSNTLTFAVGAATALFSANAAAGAPTQLVVTSGDAQSALAGTTIAQVPQLALRDQYGNGVDGKTATFTVMEGSGSIASASATSSADGVIAAPAWTLGKYALPQRLRATVGALTADVTASVTTAYNIDVRFFGDAMTPEQQALFTTAAARLSAIITADVANVQASGFDVAQACGLSGLPVLDETIDDVIIYASIADIDGPGQILAQAGPCAYRSSTYGYLPAVGVMQFDVADLATLTSGGSLQDVITHEMLHVLGFGATLFDADGYLVDYDLPTVNYIGPQGRQGCLDVGGTVTCATSVPLENVGGAGTANSHWRESVFDNELMTGYANAGPMPISRMTIGALADLGYGINMAARDDYQIPGGALRAGTRTIVSAGWERALPIPPIVLGADGRPQPLPPRLTRRPR